MRGGKVKKYRLKKELDIFGGEGSIMSYQCTFRGLSIVIRILSCTASQKMSYKFAVMNY